MTLFPRLALAGCLIAAAAAPALAFDAKEKEEIGKIVREYLIQNPDVLYEAQKEWNRRQEEETAKKREVALKDYLARIDKSGLHASIGNPQGDVTLVEFFDYNCGYCRRAISDLDALMKADPKLKIVLLELPVIREESVGAAQVSLAVNTIAKDKFRAFHDRLLGGQGLATKTSAIAAAKAVGVDEAALQKAMGAPEIEQALIEAKELADSLGVDATPTYVIGDSVVLNTNRVVADLKGRAAAVRTCGKAVC